MDIKQVQGFYGTPSLWNGHQFGIQQFVFPEVDFTSFSPEEIPQNIRLGHQMEHAFEQLITHESTYEILLKNQAIRSDKITIGEIDFILKHTKTKEIQHVELTYKFYIVDSSISEPIHRLMGPNRRDMFFTKLDKIKNEQFSLIHAAETQNILKSHDINPEAVQHQCCFKAQLFRPFNELKVHIRPLNPDCVAGYWMPFHEFEKSSLKDCSFYIPFKKEWPITPHEEVEWLSYLETLMEVNIRMIKKNAPMLWVKKPSGTFEKLFVVWW